MRLLSKTVMLEHTTTFRMTAASPNSHSCPIYSEKGVLNFNWWRFKLTLNGQLYFGLPSTSVLHTFITGKEITETFVKVCQIVENMISVISSVGGCLCAWYYTEEVVIPTKWVSYYQILRFRWSECCWNMLDKKFAAVICLVRKHQLLWPRNSWKASRYTYGSWNCSQHNNVISNHSFSSRVAATLGKQGTCAFSRNLLQHRESFGGKYFWLFINAESMYLFTHFKEF